MKRTVILVLLVFLSACTPQAAPPPTPLPTDTPARPIPTSRQNLPTQSQATVRPEATVTKTPRPGSTSSSTPPATSTQTAISETPSATPITNDWMELPILPEPDANVIRTIYERGQALGNDPNAFSLFGDCQARPDEFFGPYETDPALVESLPVELQDAVSQFSGSFNRESPTAQDGTTPGALLWSQWHRGEFGCSFTESPVECELRIHKPSFVIIQIGSHFESRNTDYLRTVINTLIENGVVPILATKGDNREKDFRVNRDMAMLAEEYDLPLWNFWASLSDLPNHGLYTRSDRPLQGDIYLTDDAKVIHRETGLEALNIVWRATTGQ